MKISNSDKIISQFNKNKLNSSSSGKANSLALAAVKARWIGDVSELDRLMLEVETMRN